MAAASLYYDVAPGKVLPYPDEEGVELENLYQENKRQQGFSKVTLVSGKYQYEIDFGQMIQTNRQTMRTRGIQRRQNPRHRELLDQLAEKDQVIGQLGGQLHNAQTDAMTAERLAQQQVVKLADQLDEHKTISRAAEEAVAAQRKETEAQQQQVNALQRDLTAVEGKLRDEKVRAAALQQDLAVATATAASAQQVRKVWHFENHLRAWQPYDHESGRQLMSFYLAWVEDGMQDREFQLSATHEVNFARSWQQNIKTGMQRPIRLVETTAGSDDDEVNVTEVVSRLQRELQESRLQCKSMAAMQQDLEEWQELHVQQQELEEEKHTASQLLADAERKSVRMLAEAKAEIDAIRAAWQCQATADKKELSQELAQTRAELAGLLQRRTEEERQLREQAEMKPQLQKQFELLTGQCDGLRAELSMLRQDSEVAKKVLLALDTKQRQLDDRESQVTEQERSLEPRLVSARSEMTELRSARDEVAKQVQDLKEQAASKHAEIAALEQVQINKGQELQAAEEQMNKQREALEAEITQARALEEASRAAEAASQKSLQKLENKQKQLAAREVQLSEFGAQIPKHRELVRNFLLAQSAAAYQRWKLRETPHGDDDTLRRTSPLMGDEIKVMLDATKNFRGLTMSPELLCLLTDLVDPKDYVPSDTKLDPASSDFLFMQAIFQGSLESHRLDYHSDEWCEPAQLEVQSISVVAFPPELLRKYLRQRERISKRPIAELASPMDNALRPAISSKDVNEYFLFHGCPWNAVEQIQQKGWDWRLSGKQTGAMFGQGIYFASHGSKCDLYAEEDESGNKCVFLARVMLGNSLPRWRNCPETQAKDLGEFDSICALTRSSGGAVDFPEAVIFQKTLALPCFKFVYKHAPACMCNLCRRRGPG